MCVWNKVLYCLIAVLFAVFAVFAAGKYSSTKAQEEKLAKQSDELAKLQDEIASLKYEVYGGDPAKQAENWSEFGAKARLERVRSLLNGETFANCIPRDARPDEETVSFTVPASYNAAAFANRADAIAYLFDSGSAIKNADDGSDDAETNASSTEDADADADAFVAAEPTTFLGVFKIVEAQGSQVSLAPVGVFSDEEMKRLEDLGTPDRSWIVCLDRLPIDSPSDVAALAAENPNSLAAFDAATRAKLTKSLVVGVDSSAVAAETETTRFPVALQNSIETQLAVRNELNIFNARRTTALNNLIDVFFDQIAAIGTDVDDAIIAEKAAACKIADVDAVRALYAKDAEGFAARVDAARKRTAAPTYFELQTRLSAELAKTTAQRDLVASILQKAQDALAACEKSIAETLAENSRLASEIARAQIAVADKIERESKQTASVEPRVSYSGI